MNPTWIWYFGDFAIHQRLLVDTRRLERNFYRPAPWHLDDCYHNVVFLREVELTARLCDKFDVDPEPYASHAARLHQIIEERYYDPKKGAYIDSYTSGRRNISRQTNLFAIRYGFATGERANTIMKLLESPEIGPISTPYFKFYEVEALAAQGQTEAVTERIRSYWGGMLAEGATSFWEEYHPEQSGEAHLHMYGSPFAKSLCHAWGASPIYLFGRFYLGVEPTSDGYGTFTVKPSLGGLDYIRGEVPVPGGVVSVYADREIVEVTAPIDGGSLVVDGKEYPIEPNVPLRIAR